jgi:hypothetical protein
VIDAKGEIDLQSENDDVLVRHQIEGTTTTIYIYIYNDYYYMIIY